MNSFGEKIRKLREEKHLPLRVLSAYLDIDQAILSKIERGKRRAARVMIVKLAAYFDFPEDDLTIAWLSDKIGYEVADEELALQALQLAEKEIRYLAFMKISRKEIINRLASGIKNFEAIHSAWIYGSFSRGDDSPESDIDVAIKADEKFSYFDLAEVKFQLEKQVNRKIDIGFFDTFKPYILDYVKPDLKLIYERQTFR
jgi:predicted nucleotidyltransferase